MADPQEPTAPPRSVLFVCTRNAVRSAMAHHLADRHCRRRVYIDSAGLDPGLTDGFSIAVLDEVGIDLSRHEPKDIADLDLSLFDLIVSLSPEAHHNVVDMTLGRNARTEYWPVLDPSMFDGPREEKLAGYRQLRDLLQRKIEQRFRFDAPGHL